MKIKPGKWKTRNGKQALVFDVFEDVAFGRTQLSLTDNWFASKWDKCGSSHDGLPYDIIAPWEEPKPRLRVWRRVSDFSTGNGDIKICYTKPMGLDDWQPVPELDLLFNKETENG